VRQCAELKLAARSDNLLFMIRSQVSNAVIFSILVATLTGVLMLSVTGAPAIRRAAVAVQKCDLGAGVMIGQILMGQK
jgi:hypothetical protein